MAPAVGGFPWCLPALLADGAVSDDAVEALLRFYDVVDQLNRGLDREAHYDSVANERKHREESDRHRIKAYRLLSAKARAAKQHPSINGSFDRMIRAGERHDYVHAALQAKGV